LRRQTAQEFPNAQSGDTRARLRGWAAGFRQRLSAPAASDSRTAEERRLEQLERLARLREQGMLSDEELAAEKARVLSEN
jgi:hypothetical protein